MLANLRKTTKWVIIFVLFVFVAMIVLEWGAQLSDTRQSVYAVKVNGEEIPYTGIDQSYSRAIGQGGYRTDTELAALYKSIVEQVIAERLALQEAEARGFEPTADEIVEQIHRTLFRNPDGTIDMARFRRYQRDVPSSEWRRYEDQARRDIAYWKMYHAATAGVTVTEPALLDFYDIRYQRALLRHILIRPTRYVSDAAALAFYRDHPDSFYIEERARGRHILFRFRPNATEEERFQARGHAEGALLRLQTGATTFDRLYRSAEIDTSGTLLAEELDWFGRGQMEPAFDTAAFTIPVGSPSPVIETSYGYHIALVDERQGRHREPFEDIVNNVKAILVGDSEIERARQEAETLRTRIVDEGADFAEVARRNSDGLTALFGGRLGYVSPGEINPALYGDTVALRLIASEIGTRTDGTFSVNPSITRELFKLEEGTVSEVVGSTHGFHVLRVDDRLGGDPDKWDLVRAQLEREYRELLRNQIFKDWTDHLRASADIQFSDHVKSRMER